MATNPSYMAVTLALATRDPIKELHSKWDTIFQLNQWIAFKPALGSYVYPCYSCQQMFSRKKTFLDHINRRAVLLKFTCTDCDNELMTFYNRCSFLLHCRKHYTLKKAQLNLKHLEVSTLPFRLVGYFRIPEVPYLFDLEEDLISDDVFMNSQFYTPDPEDKGKEIVTLRPNSLVLDQRSPDGEVQSLALKQVARNIPKCQFITLQAFKEILDNLEALNQASVEEVKNELPDEITFRTWVTESQQLGNRVSTNSSSGESDQLIISEPSGNSTQSDQEEETNPLMLVKVETVLDEQNIINNGEQSIINQNGLTTSSDRCSECKTPVHESLQSHFLGDNKPSDVILRCHDCKLISPTLCSFQAHERIHLQLAPYVCPDCGIEYVSRSELLQHMLDVCFHMGKSVRIKCPGRRCGKVFASEATFGLHFRQTHVDSFYLCSSCDHAFTCLQECEEHCQIHEERSYEKFYTCLGCSQDAMTLSELKKHIEYHCNNLCRYIYVYMCKFCKGYFRSVQTMGNHFGKCRVQKFGLPARVRSNPTIPTTLSGSKFTSSKYTSGQCLTCSTKIIFLKSKPSYYCKKCVGKPDQNSAPVVLNGWFCPLCKSFIDVSDKEKHKMECKFSAPRIVLEKLDLTKILEQRQNASSNNVDISSPRKGSRSDSSPDENRPRKRPRLIKPKKPEIVHDLTAEEPIQFNGTYHCRLCDYTDAQRATFQDHIKNHRAISTAYQCMDCGECFVVKPSLMKHLLHYHHIADLEKYFRENDCFDEGAVNELAKVVRAPYLVNIVKENQCRVCFEQLNSAEEHDKHFRTHGMAFLMKSSI